MTFHSKVDNTRNTHICSIETLTLKEELTFIDIDSVTVEYIIIMHTVCHNTIFSSLVVCAYMAIQIYSVATIILSSSDQIRFCYCN